MASFLIVEDHPLFREALQAAVRLVAPDAAISEASSISGALERLALDSALDLVLLDLSMPDTSRLSGLTQIRAAFPKLPLLVVSSHQEARIIREALALGVAGYVSKSASKEELSGAIREVLNGSVYLAPDLRAAVESDAGDHREQDLLDRIRHLTPQQLRVLMMLREGLQNKQIAHELDVAETTVKAHVSEILRKLKVFSRTKAVVEIASLDLSGLAPSTDQKSH